MWSNSNGVNNNVQSAELTFFMIEEIDSVLDTFGYGEVLGLGQPLDTDTTAPSSYSLVNALYYANVIN
jgi:TPP-dependent trihydroxycyclohexane-1,2-dione (THcHDO) dehydratase